MSQHQGSIRGRLSRCLDPPRVGAEGVCQRCYIQRPAIARALAQPYSHQIYIGSEAAFRRFHTSAGGPHNMSPLYYKNNNLSEDPTGRNSVYVDKDGTMHLDGDPAFSDEFSERAWLGHYSCKSAEHRQSYVLRLKNALSRRAWRLTHTRPELAVTKLLADAEAKPKETFVIFLAVVRAGCEKEVLLRKHEAFNNLFRKDARAQGEVIQVYIARREMEHEKLTQLSPSTTLSEDFRAYFRRIGGTRCSLPLHKLAGSCVPILIPLVHGRREQPRRELCRLPQH